MSDLKLVIGDKNRSPWSLRAWLLLRHLELEFDEIRVALGRADTVEQVRRYSPSGRLPVLLAGDIRVWDALAIAEFLADHFPSLWPDGADARALARSISAELHAGFRELDTFLPLDFTARFSPPGRLLGPVAAEVRRVLDIWGHCRTGFGQDGPFLFGPFTAADAMFAPVCVQVATHGLQLDQTGREYVRTITSLPAMEEWAEAARDEVGTAVLRAAPPVPPAAPTLAREELQPPEPDLTAPPWTEPQALEPPPAEPEPALSVALARGPYPYPDEEEDEGPPAPGLPGVVPTQRYEGEDQAAAGLGQRLVRPVAPRGLFRWRHPVRAAEPDPVEPAPHPDDRPLPEPPRRAAAEQPFDAPPPPAGPRSAEPVGEPGAAQPRPGGRSEAIKPIGDGIHRRR